MSRYSNSATTFVSTDVALGFLMGLVSLDFGVTTESSSFRIWLLSQFSLDAASNNFCALPSTCSLKRMEIRRSLFCLRGRLGLRLYAASSRRRYKDLNRQRVIDHIAAKIWIVTVRLSTSICSPRARQ